MLRSTEVLLFPPLDLLGTFTLENLMSVAHKSLNFELNFQNHYFWLFSQIPPAGTKSVEVKSQNRKIAHENWYFRETYNNPEQESQIAVYSNTLWWEGSEFLKGENFEKELTGNLQSVSNTEIFNKEIKSAANLVTI